MVCNHAVKNLIREAKSQLINNSIMTGKQDGMQLLDQHLKDLIAQGLVSPEEAARYAENPQTILMGTKSNAPPADGPRPKGSAL
jgi:twitching motility protein PilT